MIECPAAKNADELFKALLRQRVPACLVNSRTVWLEDRLRIVCYDNGSVIIQRAVHGMTKPNTSLVEEENQRVLKTGDDIIGTIVSWWEEEQHEETRAGRS